MMFGVIQIGIVDGYAAGGHNSQNGEPFGFDNRDQAQKECDKKNKQAEDLRIQTRYEICEIN